MEMLSVLFQYSSKDATMLLNMATLKDSYAPYEEEHRRLYGDTGGS